MDLKAATRILSMIALSIAACGVLRAMTGDPQSASTAPVSVGASAPCSVADYKVLTPYAVALRCKVPPTDRPDSGVLVETTKAAVTQIASGVTVTAPVISHEWLIISWPATPASILHAKRTYSLTLNYGQAASGTTPPPLVVAIDTSETVTLSAAAPSAPLDFRVVSHLAFANDQNAVSMLKLDLVKPGDLTHTFRDCRIPIKNVPDKPYQVDAQCSQLTAPFGTTPTNNELAQLDLSLVGILNLRLRTLPGTPITPSALPVNVVLGGHPSFDPKSRFARQNAPASKDAAHIYLNGNYTAGVGTAPAWTLNSKYNPILLLAGRFTVGPLLTTDIGNNTITGQTYANTIDLGATGTAIYRPGGALPSLAFTPGVTYETDRQFNRDNLLATIDTQEFFAHLYNTQQTKSFEKFRLLLQADSSAKLTDVKTPALGYALDFHAGLETGSALVDTTVKASKGPAVATLPRYGIFRVVPQVHGLLQLSRLSIDELFAGRYVALTENTIVETADHALYLKHIEGWKALSTLTNTFALDTQGNLNLSVTYKSGFAPPNYKRVNAVQAGLTIKY
jgi:hypothetical protein